MARAAAALLLIALLAAAGFAVWRTQQLPPPQHRSSEAALIAVDRAGAAERLSAAVRYATIAPPSAVTADPAGEPFDAFHGFLRERFPLLHARLKLERVGAHSLLYTWTGSRPEWPPVLLAAHMDVVPADAAGWTHPPFDGVIDGGFVWGRGTLDDKNNLLAMLEATEALLALGEQPQRTILLAFGADEEIGGEEGASAIAALLQQRGVKCAFTLDEGGAISRGIVPGLDRPVASIMAGEKGYLSVRLKLSGDGGHSSTPPPRTVIGRLARAVARLEEHPLPPRLIAPVDAMFARLAPDMDYKTRLLIANRDWLQPLVLGVLARGATTDALIRTTTAATVFKAGDKDNVLPSSGEAVVNFRLLPGDRVAKVIEHVRSVIDDDGIAVEPLPGFASEAPPISNAGAPAFGVIERAVNQVFPEAVVTSGIMLGASDNRHYAAVRAQGYNFAPMPYTRDDEKRIHGVDERLAIADYLKMIQFYAQLVRGVDALP